MVYLTTGIHVYMLKVLSPSKRLLQTTVSLRSVEELER